MQSVVLMYSPFVLFEVILSFIPSVACFFNFNKTGTAATQHLKIYAKLTEQTSLYNERIQNSRKDKLVLKLYLLLINANLPVNDDIIKRAATAGIVNNMKIFILTK